MRKSELTFSCRMWPAAHSR